jgi:hypothetical protein
MNPIKDLVLLVPDKNIEFALRGLLTRSTKLNIRPLAYSILVYQERDAGCYLRGHEVLRPTLRKYSHAIVMFDRMGCGQETKSRSTLEAEVKNRLHENGWPETGEAVVIDPELEAWVWADSHVVASCIKWSNNRKPLRDWLIDKGLWDPKTAKPNDPKLALVTALRELRLPRSSEIYRSLATSLPVTSCQDAAFNRLKAILHSWFPLPPSL